MCGCRICVSSFSRAPWCDRERSVPWQSQPGPTWGTESLVWCLGMSVVTLRILGGFLDALASPSEWLQAGYKYAQKYVLVCCTALGGNCGWKKFLAAPKYKGNETPSAARQPPALKRRAPDACWTVGLLHEYRLDWCFYLPCGWGCVCEPVSLRTEINLWVYLLLSSVLQHQIVFLAI